MCSVHSSNRPKSDGNVGLTINENKRWVGLSEKTALLINLAFIPLYIWMLRMPFTILAPVIFCSVDCRRLWRDAQYVRYPANPDFLHRGLYDAASGLPAGVRCSGPCSGSDCRAHAAPVAAFVTGRSVDLFHPGRVGANSGDRLDLELSARAQTAAPYLPTAPGPDLI